MFDNALKRSVGTYVEPGEEVLRLTVVQGKGMARAMMAGGVLGASAFGAVKDRKARDEAPMTDDVRLSSKMAIAVTTRRLLIFKAGGAWTVSAKELLTEVPVERVDSIEVGGGMLTKKLTVTVDGQPYAIEAPRFGKPDKLPEALEQAKSRTAVAR